ncbi:hypothetical protein CWE21_10850 [Pseudidiomarina aquimaris]|uniref:O-antigen ligase domain-containing protein n=1 Tax=Pseudidiomarina aquimaris TaxID=641841 RepID=A0A432XD66_9GAMM|nr:O-antigen ligase family protein [Pseudidiomarina aquimaris]RUO46645.1 hypothetical protein CWE21_10850 [Pseudidiomarina aquimaris]
MKLTSTEHKLGLVLFALLVYPVIWLDTIYGLFSYLGLGGLRISLAYRLVLIMIGLYLVFTRENYVTIMVRIMVLAWACFAAWSTFPTGNFNLVSEITLFSRWLFPFAVLVITLKLFERFGDETRLLLMGIAYYGLVFGSFMLFSFATGLGIQSYGDHAFGIKSFYVGGNDIGLAALISLCFIYYFLYQHVTLSGIIKAALCIAGLILLGTKAGWGGSAALTLLFVFLIVVFKVANTVFKKVSKYLLMTVIITGVIAAYQYTNKNIDEFRYQLTQVNQIIEGASPRQRLINAADRSLARFDEEVIWTGGGVKFYEMVGREYYLEQNNIDEFLTYKNIEQEWYDLFGGYGIIFALLVSIMHLFFVLMSLLLYVRAPSSLHLFLTTSVVVFFAHGMFAGHAFVSGQPGGLIGVVYAILCLRLRIFFGISTSRESA